VNPLRPPRSALWGAAALLAIALAAAFAVTATRTIAGPNCTTDHAAIDAEEAEFLRLINEYRAQNGVQQLAVSDTLSRAAAWKSQHMGEEGYFAHDDTPIGRSWIDRIRDCGYSYNTWIGENIAAGNESAALTFEQWRTSPGHNANMLNANYNAIGIGRDFTDGSTYGWYWSTEFGGYADAPPPTSTPTRTPTRTATPPHTPDGTSGGTPPAPPPGPGDPDGDVNCDGRTTSLDAAFILQVNAGLLPALPCPNAADVNRDGIVNTIDASLILQRDAGLIQSFS
jgi:uncharacterized protein YkwD